MPLTAASSTRDCPGGTAWTELPLRSPARLAGGLERGEGRREALWKLQVKTGGDAQSLQQASLVVGT